MDLSLIILGAVIALSLASATVWHLIVKSYAWAVAGSSLTLANAVILGAVIALGLGIPFKRRRIGKARTSNDA